MINPLHIINALRSPLLHLEHIDHIIVDIKTISVGNSAVTARCRIPGIEGDSLIKCYYRTKRIAKELYGDKFYTREMRIYTLGGKVEYADILIDKWVDGIPLDVYALSNECDFKVLSLAFDRMVLQLLEADWAHGDIKPENIICRADGEMQLIDMDAVWHSGLIASDYNECGTPEFNHPKRSLMRLDKHIDDFSIALISTILAASAIDHTPFYGALDSRSKLFDPRLIANGQDHALNEALQLLAENDRAHYDIATSLSCRFGVIDNLHRMICTALGKEPSTEMATRVIDEEEIERRSRRLEQLLHADKEEDRGGKTWSFEDDERLALWFLEGHTVKSIAKSLRRSETAVRSRISKLRLNKK